MLLNNVTNKSSETNAVKMAASILAEPAPAAVANPVNLASKAGVIQGAGVGKSTGNAGGSNVVTTVLSTVLSFFTGGVGGFISSLFGGLFGGKAPFDFFKTALGFFPGGNALKKFMGL